MKVQKNLKSRLRKAVAMELVSYITKANEGQKKMIFGKPFTYSGGKWVSDKGGAGRKKDVSQETEDSGRSINEANEPKVRDLKVDDVYRMDGDDLKRYHKKLSHVLQNDKSLTPKDKKRLKDVHSEVKDQIMQMKAEMNAYQNPDFDISS